MAETTYYTLVASLPYLRFFSEAERLPINRERLMTRLRMLSEQDLQTVRQVFDVIGWRGQPMSRTDEEVLDFYAAVVRRTKNPELADMIGFRLAQRTVVAALRRRRRGLPAPGMDERWGAGPLVDYVRRHWDQRDLGLARILPWVVQAGQFMEEGNSLELERLLMTLTWHYLDSRVVGREFSFIAVLAYLFKWDMVERWLSHEAEASRMRFGGLLEEAANGHIA